jgi:hypothetical protein
MVNLRSLNHKRCLIAGVSHGGQYMAVPGNFPMMSITPLSLTARQEKNLKSAAD